MKRIIFLLGIILLFSSNLCFADQPTQVNNGRYVIYQNPQFRGDQFILDTKTGKVWQMVQAKDGSRIWDQMFFDCYNEDKTYSGKYVNPR